MDDRSGAVWRETRRILMKSHLNTHTHTHIDTHRHTHTQIQTHTQAAHTRHTLSMVIVERCEGATPATGNASLGHAFVVETSHWLAVLVRFVLNIFIMRMHKSRLLFFYPECFALVKRKHCRGNTSQQGRLLVEDDHGDRLVRQPRSPAPTRLTRPVTGRSTASGVGKQRVT